MKLCRLVLAVVGATVLLGTVVSTASARRIEFNSQFERVLYSSIRFHMPEGTVICHMTLESSMHSRTLTKVIGSLIGYITSAILGPCQDGTATVLRETLPWHQRYSGFTGRLPAITNIKVHTIGWDVKVRPSGGNACLTRSATTEPVLETDIVEAGGNLTTAELSGTITTGMECFGLGGSFTALPGRILVSGTANALRARLI